jgi:hypothetical protein
MDDPIRATVRGQLVLVRRGRKTLTLLTPREADALAFDLMVRANEVRATAPVDPTGGPEVAW